MLTALGRFLALPLVLLVRIYSYVISPLLGTNCRYEPTCSTYAIEALQKYGAFRGTALAARRIARCHPWGGSGYDPLPGEESDKDDDGQTR